MLSEETSSPTSSLRSLFLFYCDEKRKSEPKKKNTQKITASLRAAKSNGSSLKAEPSTLYARYRGYAARSHENPPALCAPPPAWLLALNGSATPPPSRRRFALCSQSAFTREAFTLPPL